MRRWWFFRLWSISQFHFQRIITKVSARDGRNSSLRGRSRRWTQGALPRNVLRFCFDVMRVEYSIIFFIFDLVGAYVVLDL